MQALEHGVTPAASDATASAEEPSSNAPEVEPETPRRVLVVEDEAEIAELVALHLRDAGYMVEVATDGGQGLAAAAGGTFDLVVLDLMLPVLDGLALCRSLRSNGHGVPILMVTARESESDRILGLDCGADDYLTKPFSLRELVARVRAIFRRIELQAQAPSPNPLDSALLEVGDISVDPGRRVATVRGEDVRLTPREFDLLLFFCQSPGRVFRRMELLQEVWGYAYEGYDHAVNSHINRLRSKIEEDPNAPELILTVWGVGYKLNEPTSCA